MQKTSPRKGAPNRCCITLTASGIAFDDHGLVQCRRAPPSHPRPAPWPAPTPPEFPRPRRRAGPGELTGDKMMTLVASALAAATASTTPICAPAGPPACSVSRLSSLHPGYLPCAAQPCPPTVLGDRELLARAWAAGAGPGDVSTWTPPSTYGLAKEGEPPRLTPAAGLSPAGPSPPAPAMC